MQNFVIYAALIGILSHEKYIRVHEEPTNNPPLSPRAD